VPLCVVPIVHKLGFLHSIHSNLIQGAMPSLTSNLEPTVLTPIATQTPTIPPAVSDSSSQMIIFGALGLLAAIIGVAIALLQLRHMQHQRRERVAVFELA
jgi:hypothetical protein